MPRDNKVGALAGVRLFAPLNRRELGRIARASEVVTVPAGTEVVTEGAVGDDFYVVLDGVAVMRRRRRKVATLETGSAFGELALLDGGPRSASVTAETDLRLLALTARQFATVIEEIPVVGRKLLVGLTARLREADARAASN
jgi:CRP/FNR family cyclic AMP-dependent transcriptional regulator